MPVADALAEVSAKLGTGPAALVSVVFGRWEEIVGASVAAHVQPLRIDGDRILVAADHPAWVTQMRHLAPQILERLREVCGEGGAPKQLEVRVRPSR